MQQHPLLQHNVHLFAWQQQLQQLQMHQMLMQPWTTMHPMLMQQHLQQQQLACALMQHPVPLPAMTAAGNASSLHHQHPLMAVAAHQQVSRHTTLLQMCSPMNHPGS
jgi:hypothetical protein